MKNLLLLIFLFSLNAYGTSCWIDFHEVIVAKENGNSSLQFNLDGAEYVFAAEAISTIKTTIRNKGEEQAIADISTKFPIERQLKGNSDDELTVEGRFGCGCHYDFERGVRYLVLASTERDTGSIITISCRYIRPATEELVEYIQDNISLH